MLASSFAKSGGRNFDEEMCKHFAAEFAERFAEILSVFLVLIDFICVGSS